MTRNASIVILALSICVALCAGFILGERYGAGGVHIGAVYSYKLPAERGIGTPFAAELAQR